MSTDTARSLLTDRQDALEKKRAELTLGQKVVTSCSEYLPLKEMEVGEAIANQVVRSEYLACDVLSLVPAEARVEALPSGAYGNALAERLDLRTFPSSLGPRVTDEEHTFGALFPDELQGTPTGLDVQTSNWAYSLQVVVVLDLDQDGTSEWTFGFRTRPETATTEATQLCCSGTLRVRAV